jgi:hypothetical protein
MLDQPSLCLRCYTANIGFADIELGCPLTILLRALRVAAALAIGFSAAASLAQTTTRAPAEVPGALADWQTWVLRGSEHRRCPYLATQSPTDSSAFRCAWPEQLTLTLDGAGGRFAQSWQVFGDSWLHLPGSVEHWPRDVRINGATAAIVLREGAPQVRVGPGRYAVTGTYRWRTRPESLPLAPQTALIALTVDGQRTAQPERPNGAVWLGKRRTAEQPAALEVQVYRLVRDSVPVELDTVVRLQVAGDAREELLGVALPDGFVPLALQSELAARLEPDGRLRVQVRPGAFEVRITARGADVAQALRRSAPGGTWPREEVWSFESNDRLRVAGPEGVEGIDPAQANVPSIWHGFPAFRMALDSVLQVVERSRGLANADDNRLTLQRQLWLDFDHGGFTAVDNISGAMRRDWRLDMRAPYRLESARLGAESLLVTKGGEAGLTGVELRAPQMQLTTVARTQDTRGAVPATGWAQRFDGVNGTLYLPPGHRLLAAPGADEAPGSWLANWGLWNLFGVLIVVIFTYWVGGPLAAALAAVGLALFYQEQPLFIWLWGNLLAAIAIARAAPEGRFRRFASGYRTVSFLLLGLSLLPFLWGQIRVALYPQLEASATYSPAMANITAEAVSPPPMVAAPAPAPESQVAMDAAGAAADAAAGAAEELEESVVTAQRMEPPADVPESRRDTARAYVESAVGLNTVQRVQRYAPGTLLQAGPGIPAWQYNVYAYRWSGPVEADQTVRFLYVGPTAMFFWRFIGVFATVALLLLLAATSFRDGGWLATRAGWLRSALLHVPASTAAAAALLLVGLGAPAVASANSTPDPQLLNELRERLLAPPKCAPTCADIAAARVDVAGDRLEVILQASALTTVAVAMPHANDRWQLDSVTIDGRTALAVGREGDASLWVPLTPGARTIRLVGRLAAAESVQLVFPQSPRTIDIVAKGWTASGVTEGRLAAGSLELTRERAAAGTAAQALEAAAEFPAFVRVDRSFDLDLDWTIDTTVSRVAPQRAAINVEVPLVAGESVLTDGVELRDGNAVVVGMTPTQGQFVWQSGLPRGESLVIGMPKDVARAEVWRFRVNPQWRVAFEGFPPVLPESDVTQWSFVFFPRPGETLKLGITRPQPAEGRTFAIDAVQHRVVVGRRSSDVSLAFNYRSTQGGRHAIAVPADARVTNVNVDGSPIQLRPENGELSIALLPGQHQVQVDWQQSDGASWRTRPAPVDLRAPASNVRTSLVLAESRWPLFAFGKGVGPAVLYWGELVVFLLTAWLLARWAPSPLRFHEWLLLGLGLSTVSWWVFAFTALWLFAMRWRERWTGGASRLAFNAVQVLLAAFTVIVVASIVFFGIQYGLISTPNMGVAGPGSGNGEFAWFVDQTQSALPAPTVITVPMSIYRWLMIAWALWMAAALVRWLRWAFKAWTAREFWRGKVIVPTATSTPGAA